MQALRSISMSVTMRAQRPGAMPVAAELRSGADDDLQPIVADVPGWRGCKSDR